jgi:pimeloyl-ACP methyl ester carboxylesterase
VVFVFVAAVGVVVVVVAHLAVGWVIANGLYRSALEVGPKEKDLAVRVRQVSADRIVLESPTPRQDTGHPGIVGIAWEEGYGRAGDVEDVEGSRFIRSYEPVTGMPPICVGRLESCPPIEIDSFAFPTGPGDVGLEFEDITYQSPLGSMSAWLVPARGPTWAIHCHGWTTERREHIRMLPSFHRAGITSMVIEYRNDPGAPLDPSGRHRFGLTEWEDLEAAVEKALDLGAEDIVLSGCSTGAALAMAFLEKSELASSVEGVVLDAPNIDLVEAFRRATRDLRATRLMIESGLWITDLRWKVDWETTDFVSRAGDYLTVPTLVFHGTSDQVIPIDVSRRLKAVVPGVVDLVETPAAGHVMSWNAAPARYERYLENFLGRLVG